MKNKVPLFIIIAAVALVSFIFFAAEPTGEQAFFKPISVTSIQETKDVITQNTTELIPFISGRYFGYHDKNGKLIFSTPRTENFSLCGTLRTSYEFISPFTGNDSTVVEPQSVQIFSAGGKEQCSIPANGYIYLHEGRIFVFLLSGNSLCEYDTNGTLLWTYSMPGIITAFDCNANFVVLGSSDGAIACLDKSGKEKFLFYPGGSTVQIIYGLAISPNGQQLACVCGLDQQRFILAEVNDYHKIVFHRFLQNSSRKQLNMFFDKSCKYLFAETADGIVILDCQRLQLTQSGISGKLTNTSVEISKDAFALLSQNADTATLSFFDMKCRKFAETDFTCSSSSLSQFGNEYFLIADEKIIRFSLNKQ